MMAGREHFEDVNLCFLCHESSNPSLDIPSAQLDLDSIHSKYIQMCRENIAACIAPDILSRSRCLLRPLTSAMSAAMLSMNHMPLRLRC